MRINHTDVTAPQESKPERLAKRIWDNATPRVMSVTFTGMLLSLATDILIAAKLGTGQVADALIIALSLPLLVDIVIREGTKFSLVPLFVEKHNSLNEGKYHRFVSGSLNLALVMGLIIAVICWLLASCIVAALGPGLTDQGKSAAGLILRIVAPVIFFALGIAVLSVLLNSQRYFTLVALRNVVTCGVVILTIGLSWENQHILFWIAAAYTVGFASFFLILWYGAKNTGYQHSWRAWPKAKDIRGLWNSASPPILGFIFRQGTRIIERGLATLVAVGGVASYYFAFRMFSAIQILVGVSIATTSLPTLTQHSLLNERAKFAATLRQRLFWTLVLSLPVTIIVIVFHNKIVRLVFGHGAFDEVSIQQTSQVLVYLAVGMIFFTAIPVLNSGLYARRAYGLILRNMVTIGVANVILAWFLVRWWGLNGLATAASVSAILSLGNLMYLLVRKSGIPLSAGLNDLSLNDLFKVG